MEHDYARVFRETGPHLWRALYAFTGGRRQVAEEAMAEAFARAMEHRGVRDPAAWIYRTAFRIARLELERERRRSQSRTSVPTFPLASTTCSKRCSSSRQTSAPRSSCTTRPISQSRRSPGAWASPSPPSASTSTAPVPVSASS